MMRAASALLLVLGLVLGCGGGGVPAARTVRTEVHLVRGDVRERLGVAPEQARIAAASAALEKAVGHPVAIEVDAALTPSSNSGLETQTANSIEALARIFSDAQRDPLLQAFVQKRLTTIAARYRASVDGTEATFDEKSGTLVFTMREAGWNGWLPSGYALDGALGDAVMRELDGRFAQKEPGALRAEDYAAYFRYLTTGRIARGRGPGDADDERAERALDLLRFEPLVRGKPLQADVETSLADDAPFVVGAKNTRGPRAELRAAYARWIDERFFAMGAAPRDRIYQALYRERGACPSDPCAAFPELDRTRLALGFFDHPAPADERDFGAFDQALCLHEEKNGKLDRSRSCANVYEFLTENDARAERLVATLVRLKRRDLLLAALVNARKQTPVLLGALERKGGPLYVEALRAILEVDHYRFREERSALDSEATRLWAKRPDLRPTLLYAVVEDYAHSGRSDEAFEKLPREFGPLDTELFTRFLDESPRSMELAAIMWPALKNVSRPFELIARRLDAYVKRRGLDAAKLVTALAQRACETRDLEGLRVIRGVLESRVKAGDRDSVALALSVRDCKAATATSR